MTASSGIQQKLQVVLQLSDYMTLTLNSTIHTIQTTGTCSQPAVKEDYFGVPPTFRVMWQSCSAYSLSSKYRSSLNPYAVLFMTFILLLMPSTFPVDIWQSYHASMPVLCAITVVAIFIFTNCGTLLSWACFTQSSITISALFLLTCVQISLSCSLTSRIDVYLTSNKACLQKYLIIRRSRKKHLLDL